MVRLAELIFFFKHHKASVDFRPCRLRVRNGCSGTQQTAGASLTGALNAAQHPSAMPPHRLLQQSEVHAEERAVTVRRRTRHRHGGLCRFPSVSAGYLLTSL